MVHLLWSVIRRRSAIRRVHYWRFHCIHLQCCKCIQEMQHKHERLLLAVCPFSASWRIFLEGRVMGLALPQTKHTDAACSHSSENSVEVLNCSTSLHGCMSCIFLLNMVLFVFSVTGYSTINEKGCCSAPPVKYVHTVWFIFYMQMVYILN